MVTIGCKNQKKTTIDLDSSDYIRDSIVIVFYLTIIIRRFWVYLVNEVFIIGFMDFETQEVSITLERVENYTKSITCKKIKAKCVDKGFTLINNLFFNFRVEYSHPDLYRRTLS